MRTVNARGARQVAGWMAVACAALLATACGSSGSPAASSAAGTPATTAGRTFLAEGQDIQGTFLYRPACRSGCSLSGDGTAILDTMTWSAWSATEAVGTGIYRLDGCDPNCAAGPEYPVPTVVTLSHPAKVCSASGTRYVWTRASFRFPHGLPRALQGSSGPENPWVFSALVSAAQQSCAG